MKKFALPNATVFIEENGVILKSDNITASFTKDSTTICTAKNANRTNKLNFAMAYLAVKEAIDCEGIHISQDMTFKRYATQDYLREIAIVEIL